MTRSPPDDLYRDGFEPAQYLRTYYAATVTDDERQVLNALCESFKGGGLMFDRCLEVGCGPTVHHAIPLVPYVREVHMSDYLPENLAEVRRWLDADPQAHDWTAHIRAVLAAEGSKGDPEAVARRAADLRRVVSALRVCDLRDVEPLGVDDRYDLVVSFYTAECVAGTRDEWRLVMRNLLGLVRPGGRVVLASVLDCERYDVAGRWFPTVPVSTDDVPAVLADNGFRQDRIEVRVLPTRDMAAHGFSGTYFATATRGER
jgi:SAM-dependent methyltransferase